MRIGIDLGGTKIEAIALDPAGKELVRERQPTPAGDYAGTLEAIQVLYQRVAQQLGTSYALQLRDSAGLSPKRRNTGLRIRN